MSRVRINRWVLPLWVAGCALAGVALVPVSAEVKIIDQDGKLKVETDGKLFSDYIYQNTSRPYLYPVLLGPKGLPMTRNWPMKDVGDEEKDHPHQKSFWYAHGDVNGIDFWAEGADKGKIVHEKFIEVAGGDKQGVIRSRNRWVAPDGKIVCTDERKLRFQPEGEAMLVDFEITIQASNGDVKMGDTKEGTMGLRLAETMRLKGKTGKGHIVNSAGQKDDDTWGKRADWCDYYGPVQNTTVGVAIFDHPKNPRHPTWWHVREYGLFAANPFGLHDFEKSPKNTGDFAIPKGQSVIFRYRFFFHPGDTQAAAVADHYQQYVSDVP